MKLFFCFLCVYAYFNSVAWATTGTSVRDLSEVKAKIDQVGRDVKKLSTEKAEQMEELRRLEKQYGEKVNVLNEVKAEVEQQEQMLQQVRDKIEVTRKSLQAQRRNFEGLVRSVYMMGDKQGIDVLFNQRDPALSGRMLIYYDYIGKERLRKLQAIEEDVKTLKTLESQKDTEAQLLQVSLRKKQQELDALAGLKAEREKLLAQINREYASKQRELSGLVQDEKKLEALLASLQHDNASPPQLSPPVSVKQSESVVSAPQPKTAQFKSADERQKPIQPGKAFAELQGKLPWPVTGSLVERFGDRRFETRWDGAVINASEGAAIHAVADGRVVFADWLRGYGLMTIIDHGKGYMSLYAFNQSLHKKVGEFVRAGETLASVGRSGGRSQAALYFGIRVKGRAVDPEKWCRKLGKG